MFVFGDGRQLCDCRVKRFSYSHCNILSDILNTVSSAGVSSTDDNSDSNIFFEVPLRLLARYLSLLGEISLTFARFYEHEDVLGVRSRQD